MVMMSGMHAHRPGRIVLLDDTSSSGKTSISACLLELLDPPHFHMAVDAIHAMRAKGKTRELASDELPAVLRRTRAGFHRAVAGMAAAGNDVVMDHVLSEAWRLQDCLELFAPFEVTFAAVRCPLEWGLASTHGRLAHTGQVTAQRDHSEHHQQQEHPCMPYRIDRTPHGDPHLASDPAAARAQTRTPHPNRLVAIK